MAHKTGTSVSHGKTYSNRGDVREISSHTRGIDNIVQGKLVNERRGLEEEGERLNKLISQAQYAYKCMTYLANATSSSENN
jgi:hypothetical protein